MNLRQLLHETSTIPVMRECKKSSVKLHLVCPQNNALKYVLHILLEFTTAFKGSLVVFNIRIVCEIVDQRECLAIFQQGSFSRSSIAKF